MKKALLGVLFAALLWLASCSTDFKVNAEKKEILVSYCILDVNQPKQYVRLYKAFLVEGNAIEYAQNNDLSINDATVIIKGYNTTGNLAQTINLTPETITKGAGSFYPTEVVWTTTTALNPTYKYELYAQTTDGKSISSNKISLSSGLNITFPVFSTVIRLEKKNTLKYQFTSNSIKSVDINALFLYSVKDINTNIITQDTINWQLVKNHTPGFNGVEYIYPIPEDAFAQLVNTTLPESKRISKEYTSGKLIFKISGAGQELYDYMRVNAPDNGFQETKPEYTNIIGGYGLFASRISDTTAVYNSDSTKFYIKFK